MSQIQTFSPLPCVGPYSHARKAGNMVFVSGQIGLNPETRTLAEGFAAQARQGLTNLGTVLRAAGTNYANVLKVNLYVTESENLPLVNNIYKEFFTAEPYPARAAVVVKGLPANAIFEVECTAFCP